MVAVSGHIVAVLAVTDPLKPEARGVVRSLHPAPLSQAQPTNTVHATAGSARTLQLLAHRPNHTCWS